MHERLLWISQAASTIVLQSARDGAVDDDRREFVSGTAVRLCLPEMDECIFQDFWIYSIDYVPF